jgi:phosphoribosyl 1,2-cyclic phosphodiesterase
MEICLLASSSSGNCTYVSAGETQILIDAGIELARIRSALSEIGADQGRINGLLISHEHGDHCCEAGRVASGLGCPLYISERTLPRVRRALGDHQAIQRFRVGERLTIGDLSIRTFRLFHDAVDPCGFLIEGPSHRSDRLVRVGIATDLGTVPEQLKALLRGCEALVIEANHDLEMLQGGDYPWDLKQRIRSPVGHLSNEAAAELIAELVRLGSLKVVILAHLSENNNRPELALQAVESRLDGLFRCEIHLSYHDRRSEMIEL